MAARLSAPTRSHNNSPRDKSGDRSPHAGDGPARRLQCGVSYGSSSVACSDTTSPGQSPGPASTDERRPARRPASQRCPPQLPSRAPGTRLTTPAAARTKPRRTLERASDLPRIAPTVCPRVVAGQPARARDWRERHRERRRLPARKRESGKVDRVTPTKQRKVFLACPSNVLRFSRFGLSSHQPPPAANAC
jgi:hypothetical protein